MAKPDLVDGFQLVYENAAITLKELETTLAHLEVVRAKLKLTMLSMSHHNLKLQDQSGQ